MNGDALPRRGEVWWVRVDKRRPAVVVQTDIAGGALTVALAAQRVSRDLDIFHDTVAAVSESWDADRRLLESAGCTVQPRRERLGFVEAAVTRDGDTLTVEWVRDSAYRFFQLVEHDELGLALHPFDLATNKVLALIGRSPVTGRTRSRGPGTPLPTRPVPSWNAFRPIVPARPSFRWMRTCSREARRNWSQRWLPARCSFTKGVFEVPGPGCDSRPAPGHPRIRGLWPLAVRGLGFAPVPITVVLNRTAGLRR
jgi:hypothetical protein